MPEWLEYVSFARFLVISSLFVGPITQCWERRWPDRRRTPANRRPELDSIPRSARDEARDASGATATADAALPPYELINDLLAEWFPLHVDWSAWGKFLVGRVRSSHEVAGSSARSGSVAWLTLHLGIMGYPQFLVRLDLSQERRRLRLLPASCDDVADLCCS